MVGNLWIVASQISRFQFVQLLFACHMVCNNMLGIYTNNYVIVFI
jgi:hypothetical protein